MNADQDGAEHSSIPLVRYPTTDSCCFCGVSTAMKNSEKDVSCCEECAESHIPKQIPTKIEWFEENLWVEMMKKGQPGPAFQNYRFRNGMTFSEMLTKGIELPTYPYSPRWEAKQHYLEWLQDLAVGDQFFQRHGPNGEKCGIFTVSRVTKNQIVSGAKKWSRQTGLLILNDNPIFKAEQITAKNLSLIAQQKAKEKQNAT